MSARPRKVRIKPIPDLKKEPEVKHGLGELSAAAHDAIQEVLAGYLTSPDTLRQMVKEEIARTIRYKTDPPSCSRDVQDTFLNQIIATAREQAVEEFNNPDNFKLFVEQMKVRYLADLKKELESLVANRAYVDAHSTYERAWRSYETKSRR